MQRALQPHDRLLPISSIADQLGEQRIVVDRHAPAFVHATVPPDAWSRGRQQQIDLPGTREIIVVGVFRIDAVFDGVPANLYFILCERQFFPICNPDLQVHQVEAGDQFGDWMFHL